MIDIFPSAARARDIISLDLVVFDEIREIERSIIGAVKDSKMMVRIFNTTMTNIGYYQDFENPPGTTTPPTTEPPNTTPPPIICPSPIYIPGSGDLYWKVWQGYVVDELISFQMLRVIEHFESIKYNIIRKTNQNTQINFYWELRW